MEDEFGEVQRKQFHMQEMISAVTDEGFLGDEDDEYDDLYNDINIDEGFYQALQKSELGFKTEDEGKKMEVVVKFEKQDEVVVPQGLDQMGGGGGMVLFIGDLHWWTTDADLESEMSKYGQVKEVKFYEEKASGKSKGFAQAEFYDPAALVACKEGMNGHVFNGRPCVVAITSPNNVRRMGEAQMNKYKTNQGFSQTQGRKGPADANDRGAGGKASNANYKGEDNGRNVAKMGWGRGVQEMMDKRQSRPMKDGGIDDNGGSGFFGQGLAIPPLMHPQAIMGQGCDPTDGGGPMGRAGCYGGYPGGTPVHTNILPSFPPVGYMPLPGVAAHVNPAFFSQGMSANGVWNDAHRWCKRDRALAR